MYREVSGFFFWRISSENYTIRQFYAKRCRILFRAKRALFRFGSNACTDHMYGTVGEVSIGRLFMAGWVPGILMCVLLMLAVTWSARCFGYKPEHDHPAPLSEILKALHR